ncbi:MAG: fructose PTS transporter subunit IIA [Actinomycetota bacterium]|nr:fructose PTS transporter subunit IIA [Actinomycetota bacterium]
MTALISSQLVDLDLKDDDGASTTRHLAGLLVAVGRVTDLEQFLTDVRAREAQMPTGLEGGLAIPHCRSAAVTEPTLAFGRSAAGADYGASDGPAHLVFLIAAPDGGGAEHMSVLAKLARKLVHQSFKDSLLTATDPQAVVDLIEKEVLGQ